MSRRRDAAGLMAPALLGVLLGGLLAGCSDEPEPVYQQKPTAEVSVPTYDESLEPSAAVLSLVPDAARTLVVTDFDQLRLVLGFGALDGASPPAERARFWRQVPRSSSLSTGLLRPADARLRAEFAFSQDDVAWEATYEGEEPGADGWVLAFHRDVSMASVARAVRAGVGPLRGAVVDTDRRLVTSAAVPDALESWGADPLLVGLSGREAVSTYVERGCLPFDDVFGEGMEDQLAAAPAASLRALDELDAYAVALGAELATVQLGPARSDAFERARLGDVMPSTDPEFALAMSRPVADPSTGRLGYVLTDPAAAAELTRERTLPFAVCAG